MRYSSILYFLLLSVSFWLAASMNLIVDANLTAKKGNSYPNLAQAISALLKDFALIDDENIITLKASCIGKTQYFPHLSQNITGKPSYTGSLKIIFENTPQSVDSEDICEQLPTLELAEGACIAISNMSSFAISGLNIHFTGDKCMNIISYVKTIDFSNFCFNNSETSVSLASGAYFSFEIDNMTALSMRNGIYIYDALKQITINQALEVILENITLLALGKSADTANSAFSIAIYDLIQTKLTVSNFEVICEPATLVMPSAVWTYAVHQVSISNVTISHCNFNGNSTNSPAILLVGAASTLTIQQVSLYNLTFGLYYQSMIVVSSVANAILTDFNITDVYSLNQGQNSSQIVLFNDKINTRSALQNYSATFSRWTLVNCTLNKYKTLINGIFDEYKHLGDVTIENFSLADSYLNWKSYVISLQTQGPRSGTENFPMTSILLRNVDVRNVRFRYAELVRVSILDPKFIAAIENTNLEVTNFSLSDSHLSHASIIHAEGFSTHISNVTARNTTFQAASNFYLCYTILSTVLITDARGYNLTIKDYSTFATVNFTTYRLISLDRSLDSGNGIYAETRPFMVYNCSFESIHIASNSYLLASTNPMAIVHENTFVNFLVSNSGLIELGNYPIFLSSESYIYEDASTYYPNETEKILIYPYAEKVIFQRYPELGRIYDNSRATLWKYEAENSIFFLWVNGNMITNISSSKATNLIQVYNFALKSGAIAVMNNTFMDISSRSSFNLIEGSGIKSGMFAQNTFSMMKVLGYAFSFSSSSFDKLMLESNHMSQTHKLAWYSITGTSECKEIMINANTVVNVEAEQNFIDITCGVVKKSVIIQGSIFENIFQTNSKRVIAPLSFISLKQTKDPRYAPPRFIIQDNYYSNITVLEIQGYIQGLYKSSLIFVVAINSSVQVSNNSFNLINTIPKGNAMTLSVPSIEISDCGYKNLTVGSVEGAVHVITEKILVKNCVFAGIQSLDSDGVGVLKFTNPEPEDVVLQIDIQNTTIRDNIASYSTVLYVKDSAIAMNIDSSEFANNFRTETGSLFTIWNVTESKINITNSRFRQHQDEDANYPNLKIIGVESSRSDVALYMSNLTVDATGNVNGVFAVASGEALVTVFGTQITFSAGSDASYPQFGLFQGDNFDATFVKVRIANISLGQIGLFAIKAETNSGEWHLNIIDSIFEDMHLLEAVVTISADNSSPNALDTLSVVLNNTNISRARWWSQSNGVVKSLTHRLGRSPRENGFAIVLDHCTFTNLTGETGLILSAIEPGFDSVALITNCQFDTIKARGAGAILNPSIVPFANTTRKIKNNNGNKKNPTFVISRNSFERIAAAYGTLLSWASTIKGIFFSSEDNYFDKIRCKGNGGLIFAQYFLSNDYDLSPVSYFRVVSTNDVVTGVAGTYNGGIIYAEGVTELFNITITGATLSDIRCSGDGGIACLFSPNQNSELSGTRRLLDVSEETQLGTINISNSEFRNITVMNGGVIYESTPNDTLNLVFDSNTLENITANARGGAFYFIKPIISIGSNLFEDVTAKLAGPLIYSVSDQLNLTNFSAENVIVSPFSTVASIAPTNLLVNLIPLFRDTPEITKEYESVPPYNPIFPNLTSYSLSDYQITLTLVSNGSEGPQVVYDESPRALLTLVFISSKENRTFVSGNCSNSTCAVIASTVTLRGLAGDVILVNATYDSKVYRQFQQFYIKLRGCAPGEINNTANYECVYCLPGGYSLDPNDTKCSECPTGANCAGGSDITIKQGYYKSNASSRSLLVLNCNDSGSRCVGNNTCAHPFTGPACLQCSLENGYYMSASAGTCVLCSGKRELIAVASLLLTASILYQIAMTVITYKENKKIHTRYQHEKRNTVQPGQFLVLLATYTQITYVVANLDENTVSYLLKATNTVGNPYTQVMFSLQCLYLFHIPDPFKALRFQMLVYILSPLIKVIVVIIFECFRNLIWRDPDGLGKKKSMVRVGAVAVVLILLEQPGIVGILCKYLTCAHLDPYLSDEFIKTHNSIQCHTDQYNFFKKLVVVPALTFWAFLIPLGIFVILYKIRNRLYVSESLRIVFGNLYNSYHERTYYWGIIIIIFKVLIYVLNSILKASPVFKGVLFLWLIQVYFYLLKRKTPYHFRYLYLAENCCCAAYIITLTLVFIRLSTDHYGIKYACSVMIVITVAFAGGYIIVNMLGLYFFTVKGFIQNLKEKRKKKQILLETLASLRSYHAQYPSRVDRNHRRGAICVNLPER